MDKEYSRMQFEIAKMYAMYWHAQVVSGACNQRDLLHGDGTPFTESEKTKDALDIMLRQIRRMNDISEFIAGK